MEGGRAGMGERRISVLVTRISAWASASAQGRLVRRKCPKSQRTGIPFPVMATQQEHSSWKIAAWHTSMAFVAVVGSSSLNRGRAGNSGVSLYHVPRGSRERDEAAEGVNPNIWS